MRFVYPIFLFTALLMNILFINSNELKAEENLVFAMLPQIPLNKVNEKWLPILKQIEKETGIKFDLVFPKDFNEHIEWCKSGKIDIAYSNPVSFLKMMDTATLKPMHTALCAAKSKEGFWGLFISRKDNGEIKSLTDIKGKKGTIISWASAGGYVFQQALALDNGIDMPKDCEIKIAPRNKQDLAVMQVYKKLTDFACIRNGILEMMRDQIDINEINIFAETPKYVEWIISYSNNGKIKSETLEKLKKAFLSIPESIMNDVKLPGDITNFVEVSTAEIESIKKVSERAEAK